MHRLGCEDREIETYQLLPYITNIVGIFGFVLIKVVLKANNP